MLLIFVIFQERIELFGFAARYKGSWSLKSKGMFIFCSKIYKIHSRGVYGLVVRAALESTAVSWNPTIDFGFFYVRKLSS